MLTSFSRAQIFRQFGDQNCARSDLQISLCGSSLFAALLNAEMVSRFGAPFVNSAFEGVADSLSNRAARLSVLPLDAEVVPPLDTLIFGSVISGIAVPLMI